MYVICICCGCGYSVVAVNTYYTGGVAHDNTVVSWYVASCGVTYDTVCVVIIIVYTRGVCVVSAGVYISYVSADADGVCAIDYGVAIDVAVTLLSCSCRRAYAHSHCVWYCCWR